MDFFCSWSPRAVQNLTLVPSRENAISSSGFMFRLSLGLINVKVMVSTGLRIMVRKLGIWISVTGIGPRSPQGQIDKCVCACVCLFFVSLCVMLMYCI
ncbi:hypothetical protein UPYG_G00302980 [Umbra pygmaea]|uniref:Uncharacterized protein n=1 Tax=Umbra pygmaea TaxID=75934 RepID=A0ABD0W884_UMBPY